MLCQWLDLEMDDLDWHPRHNTVSPLFLEHVLETNDVRVAVDVAAQDNGIALLEWFDDRALKSKQMKDCVTVIGPQGGEFRAAIVPDGYFHL